MKLSFYTKLINSLERIEVTTIDERQDKSAAIANVTNIIINRGGSVTWDKTKWKVTKSNEPTYELREDSIYVVGSHRVTLNEKIIDNELHEYSIVNRKDFIAELINWISEAKGSNKLLMTQDLEMLMGKNDDYILKSNSTNSYITKTDANFNDTCKELIELSEGL